MVTDEMVLAALREEEGKLVSGADLAKRLGVSRAAVWKHISQLRAVGYGIDTVPFEGYRLVSRPDLMLSAEIKSGLKTERFGREVYAFRETSSTSDVASALASGGAEEGTVVVADKQTAGRGRMGRSWESAPGVGIWMSVILRPRVPPMTVPRVTITSAVAVSELLKEEADLDAPIDWPNDIVVRDKKVCGILTEMVAEQDRVESVILGIGLNVNQTENDFSPELRENATSLYIESGVKRDRTALLQRLLERLEQLYDILQEGRFEEIVARWSANSYTLGRRVRCTADGRPVEGIAESLASDGALVVRTDGGAVRQITCGDVLYV
jgi:BirA family biotin operon repressor/biotin-[acetyl-CoA-carboxylase] ligase